MYMHQGLISPVFRGFNLPSRNLLLTVPVQTIKRASTQTKLDINISRSLRAYMPCNQSSLRHQLFSRNVVQKKALSCNSALHGQLARLLILLSPMYICETQCAPLIRVYS